MNAEFAIGIKTWYGDQSCMKSLLNTTISRWKTTVSVSKSYSFGRDKDLCNRNRDLEWEKKVFSVKIVSKRNGIVSI